MSNPQLNTTNPATAVPPIAERPDRRWLYLQRLNAIRAVCFGDGIHTTSGAVKGEDDRLRVAVQLNQLQADLGIPAGVEPTRFKCEQCRCPVNCVCCTPDHCGCKEPELFADDGFGI